LEVVRLLVEYGADVNAVSDTGRSPLQMAMEGGHEGVKEVLVGAGAVE